MTTQIPEQYVILLWALGITVVAVFIGWLIKRKFGVG
jgi:hypothetical protein